MHPVARGGGLLDTGKRSSSRTRRGVVRLRDTHVMKRDIAYIGAFDAELGEEVLFHFVLRTCNIYWLLLHKLLPD